MNIEMAGRPQDWGDLDVAMFSLEKTWDGEVAAQPVRYGMIVDHDRLWFVAAHAEPAVVHPQAEAGFFQKDLWKYDCVELFLSDPKSGRYLEVNLAANGAWWSAEFKGPRRRVDETDKPFPGVETYSDVAAEGGWVVAASFPLNELKGGFSFGDGMRMNVTAVTGSPNQIFYSANVLPGSGPDFHQPEHFSEVQFFNSEDLPQAFR